MHVLPDSQKRLLALDGGGIMGVISLQFLKEMETQLRTALEADESFRLCDYFDYIGGTSTGAIIATALSIGLSVDEISAFYDDTGADMFARAPLHRRLWYGYHAGPLEANLKRVIGTQTVLDMQQSGQLRCLLLIVMRNATTDSPWPITSNPAAVFNHPDDTQCNMKLPLWQLVRASTAAPTFFRPENIRVGNENFQFVDGGVTPYNNPAFLLYKLATLPEYGLGWNAGEDNLMLVSVGTGLAYKPAEKLSRHGRTVLGMAATASGDLIRSYAVENDINCRSVGRCVYGLPIDAELGAMLHTPEQQAHKMFTYARFDADLSVQGVRELGLDSIDPRGIRLDAVHRIADMKTIGQTAARGAVNMPLQFPRFLDGHCAGSAPE